MGATAMTGHPRPSKGQPVTTPTGASELVGAAPAVRPESQGRTPIHSSFPPDPGSS